MKTTTILFGLMVALASCERCYECRILTSSTNSSGLSQSQPPVIIEQCNMTRRENKRYVESMTNTTTVYINNKKYTTSTRAICREY